MELDWPVELELALGFIVLLLIVGLWVVNRRKMQKDNEKTSEVLRRKNQ
jgi:hypothetical protein